MKIQGKYTSAEVFAPEIEETARQFAQELCDHPAMAGFGLLRCPTSMPVGDAMSERLTRWASMSIRSMWGRHRVYDFDAQTLSSGRAG